jgi:hypothetical protein
MVVEALLTRRGQVGMRTRTFVLAERRSPGSEVPLASPVPVEPAAGAFTLDVSKRRDIGQPADAMSARVRATGRTSVRQRTGAGSR